MERERLPSSHWTVERQLAAQAIVRRWQRSWTYTIIFNVLAVVAGLGLAVLSVLLVLLPFAVLALIGNR